MKTTLFLSLLAGVSLTTGAPAQNVVVTGGGAPINQTIVVQTPVTVQCPATWSCPVASCGPVTPYCSSSPNVIYFGGPEARWRSRYYGYGYCNTPNVVYFGRGQSFYQGYRFRGCR